MSIGYVIYRTGWREPMQVMKLEGRFTNIDTQLRCLGYIVAFEGVTETYIKVMQMDEHEFIRKYGFAKVHIYEFIKNKMIIDDRIPVKQLKDIKRINDKSVTIEQLNEDLKEIYKHKYKK
jgi:hypothetical protein